MRAWLAAIGLALAIPAVTAAQRPEALDTVFVRMRSGAPLPALAMMVMHRGRIVYANVAGYADLERMVPASLDTRFDVASLAKQFTAFAVSRLVEEGRVGLAEPASRYLPEMDLGGAQVTIDQLIHHTSGIEDADGTMVLAGWKPTDPVSSTELTDLLLRQQHLRFAPGDQHFYSNGGYLLLSEIVARVSGASFSRYTDSTIFIPLGMRNTGFPADPAQLVPGRAMPYQRRAEAGLVLSRVESYAGAGGLNTTVADMMTWARQLIRPAHDSSATLRLRTPGRLNSGEPVGYAWGIGTSEYRGRAMLSHAGSGPATETQFLVIPELDFAVVAMASGPTGVNPSTLAYRAVDAFLADSLAPTKPQAGPRMMMITEEMANQRPPETEGVEVPVDRLRKLAGLYRLGDNPPMVVRARGPRLEYSWGGRPPFFPLFPMADGRFLAMPLYDAYRFPTDAAGNATGIVREQVEKSLRRGGPAREPGIRIPEPPPLDSTTAAPYVGWYYGDEVGTFYQVRLVDGRLELAHSRLGRGWLTPLGEERFLVDLPGIAQARFARAAGRIVGMELQAVSWSVTTGFRKVTLTP